VTRWAWLKNLDALACIGFIVAIASIFIVVFIAVKLWISN